MKLPDNRLRYIAALGLSLGLVCTNQVFAQSQAGAPNPAELEKLETKMFSRHYPNDPPEKRVERLELLFFGATQGGNLDERWTRISRAIKERQNPEASSAQSAGTPVPSSGAPKTSAAPQKGNYPAVDSLEWRVLKKTYRAEPIGERLSRLETKLLGQASPNMALFDRVERLKKIGATVAGDNSPRSATGLPPAILGPMPKGFPRDMPFAFEELPDGANPFSGQQAPMQPFSMQPYSMQPFSGEGSMNLGSLNRMMSEMMTQMNKQMRDLKNLPPGVYQYKIDPSDPNSGLSPFKMMPSQPRRPGQISPFQLMPKTAPSIPENLPPYADPNSI